MSKLFPLQHSLLRPHPQVVHGVFTRHGGVSLPPFGSLNVGASTGDNPEHVHENRERIRKHLDVPFIVHAEQVHGTAVHQVTRRDLPVNPGWTLLNTEGCDALFTTEKNIGLASLHADCQAAIFYDPIHQALGVAHAGWKGSVQNIYAHLISTMKITLNTNPQDLLVCISPSLGPNFAEYVDFKQDFPERLWRFQAKPNHFDFWAMSFYQLEQCGVLPHHIECPFLCTHTLLSDYFSYRRDPVTGRHATVAFLR